MRLAPATVSDYRELARGRLPRQLFDYMDGGADEEATLRANVDDLQRVLLRQVVMRDVSVRDQSLELALTGQTSVVGLDRSALYEIGSGVARQAHYSSTAHEARTRGT